MITQQALERYLWGAATLLRGLIDAGDYKQYIFPLLFFKRICDVYDEEYEIALKESRGDLKFAEFAENHRFQIPKGSHWKHVRENTKNVGMAIQKAMRQIEKANPDTLFGIFGDAQWTNKDRLSDETLINLLEHFSSQTLSIKNVPNDELGQGYEFLIKKFADDSGHTAAEFYTNRTVVQLMTLIMDTNPCESVYDPTCGSGGMLLSCVNKLKSDGKEYRSLKLYGQELNLMTSAIARMNMFLHGIEDFKIVRGDTLKHPAFLESDELKKFNIILANPPYSIKQWNRQEFEKDPYGRNIYGTPPQGCADYAFQQHIIKSLDEKNGRCAILWPHGILFRDAEAEMRKKMIESDVVEAVIGLGPNLFYNSPMEACILVCNKGKRKDRQKKILFINAVNEVKRESAFSYLTDEHIAKIHKAFIEHKDIEGFAKVVSIKDVLSHDGNMAISLYAHTQENGKTAEKEVSLSALLKNWQKVSDSLRKDLAKMIGELSVGMK
ncbi:MAG: SAM-dependent DNA methyltransferase [Planctomycetes bacterium]|uniref:type I restriction-modification system subunit M n=1 Tax=Candidatus Wunengus californicus TaxID=3367619 RepID=UPI00402545D6|nr:SAM-dependent DNA methyltransferase [Planctomycetota bacterium]